MGISRTSNLCSPLFSVAVSHLSNPLMKYHAPRTTCAVRRAKRPQTNPMRLAWASSRGDMGHVSFVPPGFTFPTLPPSAICRHCTRRELSAAATTSSAPLSTRSLRRALPCARRNDRRRQQVVVVAMTMAAEPPSSPGAASSSSTPVSTLQVDDGVDCSRRHWFAQEEDEHNSVHEAQVDAASSSQSEADSPHHHHHHVLANEPPTLPSPPVHGLGNKQHTANDASRVRRRSSNANAPFEQTVTDADTLVSPQAGPGQLSTAGREGRPEGEAEGKTEGEKAAVTRTARARRQRDRRRRDRAMTAARKSLVKKVRHLLYVGSASHYRSSSAVL